ncbi:GPI ethanolamine phosphate transferase 3 subunit O [Pancytospora epiphaga]|nr:GPI ethanolamine phosphate transferase 3 subunit O [Pancytospora epiphaga]
MLKFHILLALSILIFYKSLFTTYSSSKVENTKPISQKHYKKLIYLVLDGLRFDAIHQVKKQGKYYNNMTICTDPAVYSRLFLSIAGIPTATTSRVVSLMTGAPTNPIEILQAFSSNVVKIDNLVRRKSQNTAFFGDECWVKSFAELTGCSSTMPSYSRFDQSKREDELINELIEKINDGLISKEDQSIFVHLNTLDTYGHAFGVDHDMIQSTLKRWDGYLHRIYNTMDKDTLLVTLSDHGVTDHGQHGGASPEELASFCCFFTKDAPLENNILTVAERDGYYQFMRKFYNVDRCNTDGDWICPKVPYNVIHQDDIVVTVSYLMGVAPPFNSYGNLIPFITRDLRALKGIAELKERNGASKKASRSVKDSIGGYERYNQLLTVQIHKNLTARSWIGGIIVLLIAIFLLVKYRAVENWVVFLLVLFTLIMVSHSMYSFACEDYMWFATLVFCYHSFDSLMAFYFYVKIPKQMPMDRDRFDITKRWGILNLEKFKGVQEPIFLSGLFILWKICNLKELLNWIVFLYSKRTSSANKPNNFLQRGACRRLTQLFPQLFYIFYFMIYKADNRDLKMCLLLADPSFLSLLVIHNRPINALFILLFIINLPSASSSLVLYLILSIVPYCSDLNKMFQAINYETFFVFTDDYHKALASVSAFAYLVLPRIVHIVRLRESSSERRDCFRYITILGLYISFICSWAQFNHLTFQHYFIDRLFFTTFFTIVDIIVLAALETYICLYGADRE